MNRSGYSDDCETWDLIRWRGAVNSAIRGRRGQSFLQELASAMDAMPEKRLIANELHVDGAYCTLGVIGAVRGIDMAAIDPYDRSFIAETFNIADALSAEIMFENDDGGMYGETPEQRWKRMREWAAENIKMPEVACAGNTTVKTA